MEPYEFGKSLSVIGVNSIDDELIAAMSCVHEGGLYDAINNASVNAGCFALPLRNNGS